MFSVWAKEGNDSPHLFGQTSRDPHAAPETVGRNVSLSVKVTLYSKGTYFIDES